MSVVKKKEKFCVEKRKIRRCLLYADYSVRIFVCMEYLEISTNIEDGIRKEREKDAGMS